MHCFLESRSYIHIFLRLSHYQSFLLALRLVLHMLYGAFFYLLLRLFLISCQILTDAALLKRQKKEIEELRAKLQVCCIVWNSSANLLGNICLLGLGEVFPWRKIWRTAFPP